MMENIGTMLSATRRAQELAELPAHVDVLVVGLGATGAGVALDAASRGLSVVAVDAHDLAFGTSRWSSKLIHGGLRYLASGHIGVAYESAVERGILLTSTAPHLVRAQRFMVPLTSDVSFSKAAMTRLGLGFGDILRAVACTPRSVLPGPRRISAHQTLRLVPGLRSSGLRGAVLHWDGQVIDDARLVVGLARTAAGHGARVLTRCRALSLGATSVLRDELTGEVRELRSTVVINAAGVWAGQLDASIKLRPSRGTHLVVPSALLGDPAVGLNVPIPGEISRYMLVLPQPGGRTYVGLTDEPVEEIQDVPVPSQKEIDFLLGTLNSVFRTAVGREDIIGSFAGLRPLLAAEGRTADLSRRHAVLSTRAGVVTVVGGKLTTYRQMASDAVDQAIRVGGLSAGPCLTQRLPLVGAAGRSVLSRLDAPPRLIARYGTEAPLVAAGDLTPVAPGVDITHAELSWGATHEGALDVDDLLDRRSRVGLVPADRESAIPAARMALELQPH